MYANMGHLEEFRKNVVSDARSYKDTTFIKARKIINNVHKAIPMSADDREKFGGLVDQLRSQSKIVEED